MEQQKFERKGRIGINPLEIPDMGSVFVEIESTAVDLFKSRNYEDGIPFVVVTDMQTANAGMHLWLSGALNYQMQELAKSRKDLKGLKLEIIHKGKKKMEIEGENVQVNQYEIFELQ